MRTKRVAPNPSQIAMIVVGNWASARQTTLAVSYLQRVIAEKDILTAQGPCGDGPQCPDDGSEDQPSCSDDDCAPEDGTCTGGEHKDCKCKEAEVECPDLDKYIFFCSRCGDKGDDGKCKGVSLCHPRSRHLLTKIIRSPMTKSKTYSKDAIAWMTRIGASKLTP